MSEIHALNMMKDASERAKMLDAAWYDRPVHQTFHAFKKTSPLWSKPFRLWTPWGFTGKHRKVMHTWASLHNVETQTVWDTQLEKATDQDKIMLFSIRFTDEEWAAFEERSVVGST